MFKDRQEAAKLLAEKLGKYKNDDGIVLAIPRGGIPIGFVIANEFNFPLEIILSKKIGHPNNPEFAIGSVSLEGALIDDNVKNIPKMYIQIETEKIQKQLKEKFKMFMGDRKLADLRNKTVIIIDDGIATGNTLLSSIKAIKKRNPNKIIVAVPVAPPTTADKFKKEVDEFICLLTPQNFLGVGQFYYDFSQVSDEEVIRLLERANNKKELV